MRQSLLKEAETKGFEQGWFDGLHGKASNPRPALGIGLLDLDYLKAFKASYLDGHATASEDMQRRQRALLQSKATVQTIDHERGDA